MKNVICNKIFVLFLVIMIEVNCFASVVSDNDGASFITKAEFDTLRSSFQGQIDSYNLSIDSKIDGAISSYLAGIKLSSIEKSNFYDGTQQIVVFFDDDAITTAKNLKQGLWALDLVHQNNQMSDGSTYGNSIWTIKWSRPDTSATGFELFGMKKVNATKYLANFYSNDIKLKYIQSASWTVYKAYSSYVNVNLSSRYGWRWWAQYNNSNTPPAPATNTTSKGTSLTSLAGTSFSNMPMDLDFWHYFATVWNTGMNMTEAANVSSTYSNWSKSITYVYSTDVLNDYTKYQLFCSNRENSASMWIDSDAPYKIENFKSCYHGADLYNGGSKISYYTPTQKTSSSSWGDTGIKTYIWAIQKGNGSGNNCLMEAGNLNWQLYGGANESSYSSSSKSTNDYYEWIPITKSISNSYLYNDIDSSIMHDFTSSGFLGRIGEGIPVVICKSGVIKLEFEIDTTTLASNAVIGVKDSPFSYDGSVALENETISSKISSLMIDGVNNGNAASKTLTPGIHSFTITLSGDYDVPIFFKIAWPRASNNNSRGYFKLPKNVILTKQ